MSDVAEVFERPVLLSVMRTGVVQRMRVTCSAGHVIQEKGKSALHKIMLFLEILRVSVVIGSE